MTRLCSQRGLQLGSELLLLVEDHQRQILEHERFIGQGMRADHHAHVAGCDGRPDRFGLSGGDQAGELRDPNARAREAALEACGMLARQHSGGRGDGHLTPG